MVESDNDANDAPQEAHLLLIVTGAHLRAEVADRPLAYQLGQAVERWLEEHRELLNVQVAPVVCSDVWYVNQDTMQRHPTVSVGGPGVNVLSHEFAQNLNTAYVRENQVVIQLDPEFVDLRVSVWGMDHERTVEALNVFVERYLDGYMRAVVTQVEPEVETGGENL